MTSPVRIGLIGMGTVGTGVVRVLQDSAEHIARQAGRAVIVEHVVVQNPSKPRSIKLRGHQISNEFARVRDNPEISIVALLPVSYTHLRAHET